MQNNFLSSNSFKVRAKVSIGIVAAVIIGALTPNACGLRVLYGFAAIISLIEVHTLAASKEQPTWDGLIHAFFSLSVLAFSIIAVKIIPSTILILSIVLTMA